MDWLINHTPYLISCTTNQNLLTFFHIVLEDDALSWVVCVYSLFSCSQVVSVNLHLVMPLMNSQMLSDPSTQIFGHKKHFHVAQQKWEVILSISGCLSEPVFFDFAKVVNVLLNKHILHWNKLFFFPPHFLSNKIWKVTKYCHPLFGAG